MKFKTKNIIGSVLVALTVLATSTAYAAKGGGG